MHENATKTSVRAGRKEDCRTEDSVGGDPIHVTAFAGPGQGPSESGEMRVKNRTRTGALKEACG